MRAPQSLLDPVELVRRLDPTAIRNQIDVLDREREALIVLLRAAQRAKDTSDVKRDEARK